MSLETQTNVLPTKSGTQFIVADHPPHGVTRIDFLKISAAGLSAWLLAGCNVLSALTTPTTSPSTDATPDAPPSPPALGNTTHEIPQDLMSVINRLDDALNQRDKGKRGNILERLKGTSAIAKKLGYIAQPNKFLLGALSRAANDSALVASAKIAMSGPRSPNTTKVFDQFAAQKDHFDDTLKFWTEKPVPRTQTAYEGFDNPEGKKLKKYIQNILRAVYGAQNDYSWIIEKATLKEGGPITYGSGQLSLGKVNMASAEDRRTIADGIIHEVVGHGFDPIAQDKGPRVLDARDSIEYLASWMEVSQLAVEYLGQHDGPEMQRVSSFEAARNNLSNENIRLLNVTIYGRNIFRVLDNIGFQFGVENHSLLPSLFLGDGTPMGNKIHQMINYFHQNMTDRFLYDNQNAALVLYIQKQLSDLPIQEIPPDNQAVLGLNQILEEQIRGEHEMIAETIRHVLTGPNLPEKYAPLGNFVDKVIALYNGPTRTQAISTLKKVREEFIGK